MFQARGPFLELYMELGKRLRDTQRLVVVGYSFRDPHMNEAIRTWIRDTPLRNDPHLVVVDPSQHYLGGRLDATHRTEMQTWLQRPADEDGVLDLALNGHSDLRDAGVPDIWNP